MHRLIFATMLLMLGNGVFAADIYVKNAWLREGPPGARVLAAYLDISNASEEARYLVGAHSPSFEKTEVHETVIRSGMMNMRLVKRLEVPSFGGVSFKPNGHHIMLIGPDKPLRSGDNVELTLKFANGEEVPVTLVVKRGMAGHHQH